MRNSSLLSQFLEPNAARTKFDVSKCRIAPPSPHPKQNPDYFLKLLPPKFIKLEQKMFLQFNTKGLHHPRNLCTFHFITLTSLCVTLHVFF